MIPVSDHIARSLVPRKRFRYLTGNPFSGRISGDVDPDEVSAVYSDDNERIEQVKSDSWNNEQVHGGDIWGVIAQEGDMSRDG